MATAAGTRDSERLLRLYEVAELLGVSTVTAWRRVRAGELLAIDVGVRGRPQLRVRRSAVEDYIRSREIRPLARGRGRRAA